VEGEEGGGKRNKKDRETMRKVRHVMVKIET
jgi:hypothetical protein